MLIHFLNYVKQIHIYCHRAAPYCSWISLHAFDTLHVLSEWFINHVMFKGQKHVGILHCHPVFQKWLQKYSPSSPFSGCGFFLRARGIWVSVWKLDAVKQNGLCKSYREQKRRWQEGLSLHMHNIRNMRQMVICWLMSHTAPFAHLHHGNTWLTEDWTNFFCVYQHESLLIGHFYSMSPHSYFFKPASVFLTPEVL